MITKPNANIIFISLQRRERMKPVFMLQVFLISIGLFLLPFTAFGIDTETEKKADTGTISSDIPEMCDGCLHVFLTEKMGYTDNFYNSDAYKDDDFIILGNPGIWFMLPGETKRLSMSPTSPITPGGAMYGNYRSGNFDRMQAYLFYSPEFESYGHHTEENTINQMAEGLFNYRFSGGLAIGASNQFVHAYDERGTGDFYFETNKFNTNLLRVNMSYPVTDKTDLRMKYDHYYVDYTADRNNYRDRADNGATLSVFHKLFGETSIFGEYEFVRLSYDERNENDSDEHHFFGGIQWDASEKSTASIKAGWQIKDFEETDDQEDNFFLEILLNYEITPKSSINLAGVRRLAESDTIANNYSLYHTVSATYAQTIADKISGNIQMYLTDNEYKRFDTVVSVVEERDDTFYGVTASLDYAFTTWLSAGVEYSYKQCDSNLSNFDYTTNIVMFQLDISL